MYYSLFLMYRSSCIPFYHHPQIRDDVRWTALMLPFTEDLELVLFVSTSYAFDVYFRHWAYSHVHYPPHHVSL